MAVDEIQQEFRKKVCAQLSLRQEGLDRYNVVTPFVLDDGDHPAIVLRKESTGWVLSDEGSTYMRLTYEIDEKDLLAGNRYRIIGNTLSAFSVEDRDGELVLPIPDERFGDALFSFVQAVLRISDVTFISREVVRSTFVEDLRELLQNVVPPSRIEANWHDPERDPKALYTVDYRLNDRPVRTMEQDGQEAPAAAEGS